MKYLLNNTPTTSHRVELLPDGQVKLTQQIEFDFSNDATLTLEWFLQKVKADLSVRHTYTDNDWHLDFDPAGSDLTAFYISHRVTGRQIIMTLSTAYKLLDALQGDTARLVQED